jgi:hypothetical protein
METKHIGKVLYIDESAFRQNVSGYSKLIPAIKEMINAFTQLEIGPLSKKIFTDLINGKIQSYAETYNARNELEFSQLNIKREFFKQAFLKEADAPLETLHNTIENFNAAVEVAKAAAGSSIDLNLFEIQNNDVILPETAKESIKLQHSIVIKTEEQAELYQCYLDAKTPVEKFFNLLSKVKSLSTALPVGTEREPGLLWVDNNRQLQFSPGILHHLK